MPGVLVPLNPGTCFGLAIRCAEEPSTAPAPQPGWCSEFSPWLVLAWISECDLLQGESPLIVPLACLHAPANLSYVPEAGSLPDHLLSLLL